MNALPSKVALRRAIELVESRGKVVAAVDFWPNGKFRLLTPDQLAAAESGDDPEGEWGDHAGEAEISRA